MRKQGAGKFPALILYNEMMTVPGKNLFSQIGNQTVKNTCCKECTDTLGNKIRQNPSLLNPSRKRRIAVGAGVDIAEVNRLVKQFEQMKKMMKQMPGMMKKGRRGGGMFGKLPF